MKKISVIMLALLIWPAVVFGANGDPLLVPGSSEITTLGTITSGTWGSSATTVGVPSGGTGATTLTDHGVLVGSGTGAITPLAVGTNGQILIGSTGADPVFATLGAGEAITYTTGAGTLTIACEAASDTNKGVVELANNTEVGTGTDTTRAVTPASLEGGFNGSTNITTLGIITAGTWNGTVIGVSYGGTGVNTLTDGGVLLGNGTGDVQAMAVLADGEIILGDGTTDPTTLAAFTASTHLLKHEVGGLELNVSAWSNQIPLINSGATSGLAFKDEDDMASDSATALASQQSIKAYVDSQVSSATDPNWGTAAAKVVSATNPDEVTTGGDIYMTVEPAGGATADDIVAQLDGNVVGDVVLLRGVSSLSGTITFDKNSNLNLQADFLMNDQYDTLTLLCVAEGTPDVFIELARASNG